MKIFTKRKLCRRTSYAAYVLRKCTPRNAHLTGAITNIKEELAELEQQIGATFEKKQSFRLI